MSVNTIFQRLLSGEAVPFNDQDYSKIREACNETRKLLVQLNNEPDLNMVRNLLSEITASPIDTSTTIFPPFQINYGKTHE